MSTEIHLNPVQQEIQARGLLNSGFACVLQMPTGAGKTWLAEQAIAEVLGRGERAIYLTPLRALANELMPRWQKRFEGFEVGVFTGEYGQRQKYPVPFEDAKLLIMTPERLDACTRGWRSHWSWFPQVGLLVVDELHLLGERGRGSRLEGALMRVRRLNPFLQVLGLSATLGNRAELAEWLDGVHFGSSWRPIPIEWRCARFQRATDKPRILKEEVSRCVAGGGQSLVFVQSRRRAEALSAELRDNGVAAGHHHAGLDSANRRRLESEYRSGTLSALVSTGTLEMGLNLPARQVVLYDLQSFDGTDFVPLSVNTVWQRAGRAGRRGLDTHGEVVLLAPNWDRDVERYSAGQFEKINSWLADPRALAEQVLAELSSGLARTRGQLKRNMQQSLAAHQRRLPVLDKIVGDMLESEMLVETCAHGASKQTLRATRLGRIAVRQMLSPSTVIALARALHAEDAERLTFLDILFLCVGTDDCDTRIPVDFDELEELGSKLSEEAATMLSGGPAEIQRRLGLSGRRLLTVIKTALILRSWTRAGNTDLVAESFGCYAFEIRRLTESVERILSAAIAVLTPPKEKEAQGGNPNRKVMFDEEPPLKERVGALAAMVAHGVDEQTVTLTHIDGIGGTLARRLHEAGITDIEEMAIAEADEIGKTRGVSKVRAEKWISEAAHKMRSRSAFSFRETSGTTETHRRNWDSAIDPYRLRRSLELTARLVGDAFIVNGGLEPHRVSAQGEILACDCADFETGQVCKHVLAVRLARKEPELIWLVGRLSENAGAGSIDLFQLWFEGGRG
jgi:helicase